MPTHYEGTAEQVLALNTYIRLTRAVDALSTRIHTPDQMADLTVSQLGVLDVLRFLGPMCQKDIGLKVLKSSGNMTLVIDNLEKRGLVQRERQTNDKRFIRVSLTEAGRALIDRIMPGHVEKITGAMAALSPEEQKTLGDLCKKLGAG